MTDIYLHFRCANYRLYGNTPPVCVDAPVPIVFLVWLCLLVRARVYVRVCVARLKSNHLVPLATIIRWLSAGCNNRYSQQQTLFDDRYQLGDEAFNNKGDAAGTGPRGEEDGGADEAVAVDGLGADADTQLMQEIRIREQELRALRMLVPLKHLHPTPSSTNVLPGEEEEQTTSLRDRVFTFVNQCVYVMCPLRHRHSIVPSPASASPNLEMAAHLDRLSLCALPSTLRILTD